MNATGRKRTQKNSVSREKARQRPRQIRVGNLVLAAQNNKPLLPDQFGFLVVWYNRVCLRFSDQTRTNTLHSTTSRDVSSRNGCGGATHRRNFFTNLLGFVLFKTSYATLIEEANVARRSRNVSSVTKKLTCACTQLKLPSHSSLA